MGEFESKKKNSTAAGTILTLVLSVASAAVMVWGLWWGLHHVGVPGSTVKAEASDLAIMDRYDMHMTNTISGALDGIVQIDKVYWLSDDDQIAPEPDQSKFGTASDPAQMQEFLDAAAPLLDGQSTLFSTETELYEGSEITYYLDETIMSITWKQVEHNAVYTISEVKIAHPSQFRRFLADGTYGSDKQYQTTEMAATVNAVTASSGDFYKFRPYGIAVYNRKVYKDDPWLDTCFITGSGEMLFSRARELEGEGAVEAFVEENDVRFSLSFGPVLIEDHQICAPGRYMVGQIDDENARAALCYMGPLHYLLVVCNMEFGYGQLPTIFRFAQTLHGFGCEKAYALDGGQTAVIVTNDQLINRPTYGHQRLISDIIYFATAVPDGG